jgi:endonuclease/exonuclease/phosphatase family metal-dependent hydrolase
VILGDLNSDPVDGDSVPGAINQLLLHARVQAKRMPVSDGGRLASASRGGVNAAHRGPPAADTAAFSAKSTGNLRIDYVLPSVELEIRQAGVFWPMDGLLAGDVRASDHRLVWADLCWPGTHGE